MARIRRLRDFTDPTTLALDPDAATYVPRIMRNQISVPRSDRETFSNLRQLAYPTHNGYGDPLTAALVIDFLCRASPKQLIRAATLTRTLKAEYPQLLWDSVTVGRLLADMHALSSAQADAAGQITPNMDRRISAAGWYYILWDVPDTYRWLLGLLRYLEPRARMAVVSSRLGLPTSRSGNLWAGLAQAA